MKTQVRTVLMCGMVAVATAALTATVVSQERKSPPQLTPEQQEMHRKWEAFATPGENHKHLNFKVGRWNAVVKMWMSPNQPEPEQSNATSEFRWIMDGRYLSDNTEGQFQGQTFLGQGLSGYDNLKKKFAWVWIDNMSTGFMQGEGTYDAASKTFKYTMDAPCVESGKYVKGRSVERIIDNNQFVSEMFGPDPKTGKEFKMAEITYTRAR